MRWPDRGSRRRAWSARNRGNIAIRAEVEDALAALTADDLGDGSPLLDLGCGTGWWLERLASRGIESALLHGLELSPARAATARERAPGADVVCGDARRLPWDDGTFAAVYLLLVLSSLADAHAVAAVLKEARRTVRPGGAIAIWEPRVPSPANRDTRWISRRALRSVLGTETASLTLTVLPPLARRLGGATDALYPVLGRVPALRTHRLWIFRPPG